MALYCGEITDEEKRKQYMAFVGKMGDRRFRDRLMKDAADSMKIAGSYLPPMGTVHQGSYPERRGQGRLLAEGFGLFNLRYKQGRMYVHPPW